MKTWRIALRSLLRRPAFALAATIILALGIGGTTAMFSLVDAVLLKPLPYPHPEQMVLVTEASPAKQERQSLIAPVRLEDWNRLNRTFQVISASYSENVTDVSGSEPERLAARRVLPRYFTVFAVNPEVGRAFTRDEETYGGPSAAVISDRLWTRRFQRDPNLAGKHLIIGGASVAVVGVMPRDFAPQEFAQSHIDVWMPPQLSPGPALSRDARFVVGVGRVKPGVSAVQAQADLDRVERALAEQFPRTDRGWSATVRGLKDVIVANYRKGLLYVFAAVAFMLLIAIANIAALVLTQVQRRQSELAIRSSIGATRSQLVGTVAREVAWIGAAGVVLGCGVAAWIVTILTRVFSDVPRSQTIALDWRALLFASLAGAAAALLCGILPAIQGTRRDVVTVLAQAGRGTSGARHRWQSVLVSGQIAITVLLLAGAGLMLRSYHNLTHTNLGFEPADAITFHVGAAWNEDRQKVGNMQEELLAKFDQLPQVEAAGFANFLPASGATLRYQVQLEGIAGTQESGRLTVGERSISRGYLGALGAPILTGQDCPDLRTLAVQASTYKVLVNRRFADVYAQGRPLVGRHLILNDMGPNPAPMEIVGVVGDIREDAANLPPVPYLYVCITPGGWPDPEYVVRSRANDAALLSAIRPTVRSVDPSRAVFALQTVGDYMDTMLQQQRVNSRIVSIFALTALFLAAVGLYSLVSLVVTSRWREMGVRVALGAQPGRLLSDVLLSVARWVAYGLAAGLLITMLSSRLLRSVLYGVKPDDALTIAAVILMLVIVAMIASLAPARRATKADPMVALRYE